MTETIQQSAMRRAKQTKKQKKPKMSSPTSLTALIYLTERRIPETWKEANNARTRNRRCVHRNPEIHNIYGQLSDRT